MIQETQYCKTQMINCTNTYNLLIFCLENEVKAMDTFYLDFTKIFDTISHSVVLEKLTACGSDRNTVCWVKNWDQSVHRVHLSLSPVLFPKAQYQDKFCLEFYH